MRITRLHIVVAFLLVLAAGGYVVQVQQKRILEQERVEQKKALDAQRAQQEIQLKALAEKKEKECLEKKKELAVQAVAVAGEYWIITKKEGKALMPGQATLHSAKEALAAGDAEKAWLMARQSIEEFKAASSARKKRYYTVRAGDCLWRIAKMPQHYGKGSKWVKIWKANKQKIKNYNLIFPRQVFYIPK